MTRIINRVGDAMLARVLGREEAGACVPENGQACACVASDGYCSGGVYFRRYRQGYYNCTGACVTSTSRSLCYVKKAGVC
ncbi:hypothetical protein ACFFMM_24355 [Micromonospora chaiyaphumensis]|uniref:Uncharacterized protein n=1 Tax=Micromonospora chaiyaphumensis TaxID=307119 RepID=A0A1C4URB5_9ACTN|nr:hypothetical protein [Micromonospora chaiyaphumensis]SCE74171.1 hypothetical protein GA0070214_101934 [Micromonospora chaiyaphumensis]